MRATTGLRGRALLSLGAGFALLLGSTAAGPVQAQGFGLLDQLFSGAARQLRAPAYAAPDPYYRPERGRAARALRKAPTAKARYAGLPASPTTVPAKKPERGAILDTPGALRAILDDPTLRPGDIVVFPSGPMVFTGATRAPHRMSSFERADGSRLVGRGTAALLAGLAPPAPAKTAAKVRLRGPAARTETARATPADGPRVVYQGTLARR